MNPSKLGAFAVAGLAILLGAVAVSVFTSGDPGMLAIIGAGMAVASIGLLLLAIHLFYRQPPSSALRLRGRRPGKPLPTPLSSGQRRLSIAIGLVGLFVAGHAVVTGQHKQPRGPVMTRQKKPGQFWALVLVYGGAGAFLVYRGVRSSGLPDRNPGRQPEGQIGRPARDRRVLGPAARPAPPTGSFEDTQPIRAGRPREGDRIDDGR